MAMSRLAKRRAFGQHFLRDPRIARLIADTAIEEARRSGCRTLLEIGPGKGAITHPILEALESGSPAPIEKFVLCEMDRALAADWDLRFGQRPPHAVPHASVEEADFLELDPARWLSAPPLAVASNLPYSSGTAILVRLARHLTGIPVMVLMFQAEVARRLRADVGTKDWGSLSVWLQNRWDVRKLASVPPGAFMPPPKVDSEVVVLTRRAEDRIPVGADPRSEERWESLIRICFAHRRKMLRSGLPASGVWRNALELSGVDGTKRSEALSWDEWRRLHEALIQCAVDRPTP